MRYSKLIENIRNLTNYSDTQDEYLLIDEIVDEAEIKILNIRKRHGNYNFDKIDDFLAYIPRNVEVDSWTKSYTKLKLNFGVSETLISSSKRTNVSKLIKRLMASEFECFSLNYSCSFYYDFELDVKIKLNGSKCNSNPQEVATEFDILLKLLDNLNAEIISESKLTYNRLYDYLYTQGNI